MHDSYCVEVHTMCTTVNCVEVHTLCTTVTVLRYDCARQLTVLRYEEGR